MKKLLSLGGIVLMALLSSFTLPINQKTTNTSSVAHTADVLDLGYFTLNGQEYHAYGNPSSGNQITQLWATDNATMTDSVQITTFSGTWDDTYGPMGGGLGVTVRFTYNGRQFYSGIVYY